MSLVWFLWGCAGWFIALLIVSKLQAERKRCAKAREAHVQFVAWIKGNLIAIRGNCYDVSLHALAIVNALELAMPGRSAVDTLALRDQLEALTRRHDEWVRAIAFASNEGFQQAIKAMLDSDQGEGKQK